MDKNRRCTAIGLVSDAALAALKLAVGVLGKSAAMIADGVHSIGDCATDIVMFAMVAMGARGENKKYRYGHGKFETIAAFFISAMMLIVGAELLVGGVRDVWQALVVGIVPDAPESITLWVALAAIAVKELLYRYTTHVGKSTDNQALRAYAWHHRTDALSTLATLVGISGAIYLGEQWRVLDSVAAIVVSVMIIVPAVRIAKPSIEELLEKALPDDEVAHIAAIIDDTPGVRTHHNLRTRRNGQVRVVDVHIKVDGDITVNAAAAITGAIESKLIADYGKVITYISVEPYRGQECCERPDTTIGL